MHDSVNKPVHYNQAGIECIEAIRAMTCSMNGTSAYMAGNVLKYMWRHEYKNGLEDIHDLLHNTFHDIDDIKVDNLVVKERW